MTSICQSHDLPEVREFTALDKTFAQRRDEILDYFAYRVTQKIVEGTYHRPKVIERQAYGYRNCANLRPRILSQSDPPPKRR